MCLVDYGIPCSTTEYYPGLNFPDIDRSHVGNVPYGKRITSCTVKGTVALTYDDGPCQWSSDILDVLKKNNVKATFFVIGWKTCRGSEDHSPAEFASIIRRMYNEGHQIASHTFTHTSMDEKTTEDRIKDMVKMELVLGDILGFVPTYWRPPFGACYTKQCQTDLGALGYHSVRTIFFPPPPLPNPPLLNIHMNVSPELTNPPSQIFWDFDPRDWEGNYTYAENQFLSHFATGNPSNLSALPVMHETHKRTVHEFTQWAIDLAHEKGYKLARVGECMGDPEENWYRSTTAAMGVRGL